MFTLGIPNRQYRRATEVLTHELSTPIDFESYKQEDGFWQFNFPEADEYDFRNIVMRLKSNGVTTIGADDTLTEKKIMKLSKLIKEQENPDENNFIDLLKDRLERIQDPQYRGGKESCDLSNHFLEEIRELIEDYEENLDQDAIAMGADDVKDISPMQEQKLRRLIRKSIRENDDAKGFDDRLAKQMGMSNDEFEDQVASRDIGDDSFGSAGTDKRTQQVITDIIQQIKSINIDPMEVMEVISEEFKIKGCVGEFEFSGGAPDPNDGLPKMDPDNWGFGDNINPGNTKDQDTKRKAYIKRFGDKSPGQR